MSVAPREGGRASDGGGLMSRRFRERGGPATAAG